MNISQFILTINDNVVLKRFLYDIKNHDVGFLFAFCLQNTKQQTLTVSGYLKMVRFEYYLFGDFFFI